MSTSTYVAAQYSYKHIINVVPIANILTSETGGSTTIDPISTFINLDVLTEEVDNWITNDLPELMINNSYVDPFMEDFDTFWIWAFYEGGITNFPYIKEIGWSEGIELSSVEWSAKLPEGKVYFAVVEIERWHNGELTRRYIGLPFIFRLPFLSGDDQLGTNLIGQSYGDSAPPQ